MNKNQRAAERDYRLAKAVFKALRDKGIITGEELSALKKECAEKLWHAVVDHVTVYNDDRLVYSLKDGTEITVEL